MRGDKASIFTDAKQRSPRDFSRTPAQQCPLSVAWKPRAFGRVERRDSRRDRKCKCDVVNFAAPNEEGEPGGSARDRGEGKAEGKVRKFMYTHPG